MNTWYEYQKLEDKLCLDYLTIGEYRKYKRTCLELGIEPTKSKLVTLFDPILRDAPVFNPAIEGLRQLIKHILKRGKDEENNGMGAS